MVEALALMEALDDFAEDAPEVKLEEAELEDLILVARVVALVELDAITGSVELLDTAFAQTSRVLPISQEPVTLKLSNTTEPIAFRFAPVNLVSGTVIICVDPVMPVTSK